MHVLVRLPTAVVATVLALAVVVVYVVAVVRMSRGARWGLVAICAVALALRLVYVGSPFEFFGAAAYPPGLNDLEPDLLSHSLAIIRDHGPFELFAGFGSGGPPSALLFVLFNALPYPWLGLRWACRLHTLVGGVLSCVGVYAVARRLGIGNLGALFAAFCVGVLPWSLLYGRTSQGGDIVWHETMALWVLAALVHGAPVGVTDWLIGTVALGLLLYDYHCGRAVFWMAVLLTCVAPRPKQRVLSFLLVVVGLALFVLPTLQSTIPGVTRWTGLPLHATTAAGPVRGDRPQEAASIPVAEIPARTWRILSAFVAPTADNNWMTVATGAIHPRVLLVAAVAGFVLAGWRQRVFLAIVFGVGLVPACIGFTYASTHRMLMAFAAVPLAAAVGVEMVPPRIKWPVAALLAAWIAYASVTFYFSTDFWTPKIMNCGGCYNISKERADGWMRDFPEP
jgi:hypothetical protein